MGYWGVAYASGSFYNKPWEWYGDLERTQAVKTCHRHVQKALELSSAATPLERQLIAALCEKHAAAQADDLTELVQWEKNYSNRMRTLRENFFATHRGDYRRRSSHSGNFLRNGAKNGRQCRVDVKYYDFSGDRSDCHITSFHLHR